MQSLIGTIQLLIVCGAVLSLGFLVLLAMPKSQLRAVLMPVIGWSMAIFCGIYCISPFDVIPEAFLGPLGIVDDLGAVVVGITAASAAMNAKKD